MFNFAFSTNMLGGHNAYLSAGPDNDDVVYMVCFDNGEVRSYVY